LTKLHPSTISGSAALVCAGLWGCVVNFGASAADGRESLVFRVKPSQQPAFEEMAEPRSELANTARAAPAALAARMAPFALIPRNLDLGPATGIATSVPVAPRGAQTQPKPIAASIAISAPAVPRAIAEASTAALSGWIVQLGAFRSQAEAENALGIWRRDSAALQGVAEPIIATADLGQKGIYYRIRVSGFADSRTAGEFCREYKGGDRDCYVVP